MYALEAGLRIRMEMTRIRKKYRSWSYTKQNPEFSFLLNIENTYSQEREREKESVWEWEKETRERKKRDSTSTRLQLFWRTNVLIR